MCCCDLIRGFTGKERDSAVSLLAVTDAGDFDGVAEVAAVLAAQETPGAVRRGAVRPRPCG